MIGKQLSLFDDLPEKDVNQSLPKKKVLEPNLQEQMLDKYGLNTWQKITIFLSAKVADVIPNQSLEILGNKQEVVAIAQSFASPKLIRELRLTRNQKEDEINFSLSKNRVIYQSQDIGKIKILYKPSLPGELQARLAIESAIDRFLEYLQKVHKIAVLDESDYHVMVFIPSTKEPANFKQHWRDFIEKVAFSTYGDTQYQLPGLAQTLIAMLNSVTLADRGHGIVDVPIITQEQSNVLAAWYFAVIREVEKRQTVRQSQINNLLRELTNSNLTIKERTSKEKELQKKEKKQVEEANKYRDCFQKSFNEVLQEQQENWRKLEEINNQLKTTDLKKQNRLQKKTNELVSKIIFTQQSVNEKLHLFNQCQGDPFKFIELDQQQNPHKFQGIVDISRSFTKTAADQINATRGDIFTQCIKEMYRLLENKPSDPLPEALLREKAKMIEGRSPGDDGNDFCYSCGIALDDKRTKKWQIARFMFERPSQRPQSSNSETRPSTCPSCSVLAFASPLKITDESIILQLESKNQNSSVKLQLKNYIRMLTNKELHLSSGRYLLLASDKTQGGDLAAQKLGQFEYALAKVASIFPGEVLTDFDFYLVIQGSQKKLLPSRHLIFLKGLMSSYSQFIIISGKEINLTLGDAVRYIEQDLPVLAEYTLAKVANNYNQRDLEKTRASYWKTIQQDTEGVNMSSEELGKRAKLYRDVAALTGLTYAFASYLESTAKEHNKKNKDKENFKEIDVAREVSKLIEQVEDAVGFCYYAAFGDETKTTVQARLYQNPDNYFIYEQTKELLSKLGVTDREKTEGSPVEIVVFAFLLLMEQGLYRLGSLLLQDYQTEAGKTWLNLYADDVMKAYAYFADSKNKEGYAQEKDWKTLTYNLKLSLYTRFPELVRKLNNKEK